MSQDPVTHISILRKLCRIPSKSCQREETARVGITSHHQLLAKTQSACFTAALLDSKCNSTTPHRSLFIIDNMAEVTPPMFEDEQLDAQGQNVRLSRLYTQLCLCFPLNGMEPESLSHLHRYLEDGLKRLTMSFPWVAGHVVDEDSVFKIKPSGRFPALLVKDLRTQLPPFCEYQAKGFPFHMLDEDVIAPRKTLPERFDEPASVLLVQANLVDGGALLVVNGQHNCMDMHGQAQIIHLLAKACCNEGYTEEELRLGNLPRADIIPVLETEDSPSAQPTLPHETAGVDSGTSLQDSHTKLQCTWAYFLFSQSALVELKALAVKSMTADYVSTDDALSALIWQAVTRTRLARFDSRTVTSTFDRQVDARRHLDTPPAYTGNVVHKVSSTLPMHHILDMPLGVLASHLRTSLQSTDIAHEVRRAATKAHQATSASRSRSSQHNSGTTRGTLPPTDIRMSSWAKEDCYHVDFGGLLGKPEAVRRPNFPAWEGLVYLLPKKLDGEIAIALCLREEDMEELKGDDTFTRFCSYIV